MAQLPCIRKWFDPIETGLHDRMRDFIQAMIEAERESAVPALWVDASETRTP